MRTYIRVVASIVISMALAVEAKPEQLGIGQVKMGMPMKDVIRGDTTVCRTSGMLLKYKKCTQDEQVGKIPMEVEYSFDVDSNSLVAVHAMFRSEHFLEVYKYLADRYSMDSNIVISLYNGNKVVEYEGNEGSFILKHTEHGRFGSLVMVSSDGDKIYTKRMEEYFKK